MPGPDWLRFYAGHFVTVEVNSTFYRLPDARTFAGWHDATPPGFVMAVKASRFLTHLKRLRNPGPPLARLLGRARLLGARLGPVLFQLPATLQYDAERLRRFLAALQARRVLLRSHVSPRRPRLSRLRAVVEFRHPSWYREDVFRLLAKARVEICLHDMAGSAIARAPASRFVYVRFHGAADEYRGSYADVHLKAWSARLRRELSEGHDVYAYFNNDIDGAAVENARRLIGYVRQG